MLWVLEVAFIFCVSEVGFWYEPWIRWFGGSVVQWFGGSVVQWFGGSVIRWFGGLVVWSFGGIHVCLVDFEAVALRDRCWMSVGLVGC
jgi:hypothetical protein